MKEEKERNKTMFMAYLKGETYRSLADKYNLAQNTVFGIIKRCMNKTGFNRTNYKGETITI